MSYSFGKPEQQSVTQSRLTLHTHSERVPTLLMATAFRHNVSSSMDASHPTYRELPPLRRLSLPVHPRNVCDVHRYMLPSTLPQQRVRVPR
jgi:hypothetical protein